MQYIVLFWMFGAIFSFCGMALLARELTSNYHALEVMALRSFISLCLLGLFLLPRRHLFRTQLFSWHLIRNSTHFAGQFAWFLAIGALPFAEVFAIEFTTPIWTSLFAVFILKENMTRGKKYALFLGSLGTLIILRPGFQGIPIELLLLLVGAVGYGLSNVATKKITQQESPFTVLFYMALLQFPLSFIPSLFYWKVPSTTAWGFLFCIALAGLSAHFCLSKALQQADASLVGPIDFLRLPCIALIGYFFYQETIDIYLFIGAGFMVWGTRLSLRR